MYNMCDEGHFHHLPWLNEESKKDRKRTSPCPCFTQMIGHVFEVHEAYF